MINSWVDISEQLTETATLQVSVLPNRNSISFLTGKLVKTIKMTRAEATSHEFHFLFYFSTLKCTRWNRIMNQYSAKIHAKQVFLFSIVKQEKEFHFGSTLAIRLIHNHWKLFLIRLASVFSSNPWT